MAKGINHIGNSKRSHYQYKKRCCVIACKKRAKYLIGGKYYCKVHAREQ
jgi:hypothetical protein